MGCFARKRIVGKMITMFGALYRWILIIPTSRLKMITMFGALYTIGHLILFSAHFPSGRLLSFLFQSALNSKSSIYIFNLYSIYAYFICWSMNWKFTPSHCFSSSAQVPKTMITECKMYWLTKWNWLYSLINNCNISLNPISPFERLHALNKEKCGH